MRANTKTRQRSSDGGDAPPLEQASSSSVPKPPIQWGDHSHKLAPLLKQYTLPLVVMVDQQTLPFMDKVNFNFSQPLMVHMRRRVKKVVATSIFYEQQNNVVTQRQTEGKLLIPEDYKGWFAVMGSPNSVSGDKAVPHFRQVAQLALSKCQSFLIGGNQPVSAFHIESCDTTGSCKPQPRTLYPGDVLRMGTLYAAETTVKVKSGPFRGKKTVKKEEKFLMCADENDRDVYLPVDKRGTFYVLTVEGQSQPRIPILKMPDIVSRYKFPCLVKLIYGRVPPTPCSFTGTLLLQDCYVESSVIACTIFNMKNIFVDIPIDTDLRFFLAEFTRELVGSQAYRSACRLCHEKASTYMRNMKVAYYVEDGGNDVEDSREQLLSQMQACAGGDPPAFSSSPRLGSSSRGRPSVVGEQPLFEPPDSSSRSSKLSPVVGSGKKGRKSNPSGDDTTADSCAAAPVSSNLPAVLRKDPTFDLPEAAEVLPLERKVKPTSLPIVPARPLPEVRQTPEQTTPAGHYMTMENGTNDAFADEGVPCETSQPAVRAPPRTPPKPRKCTPSATESESLYHQVWNGQQRVLGGEGSCEPRVKAAKASVHRMSSFTFADNYLLFPVVNKGPPAKSGIVSAHPTNLSENPYELMLPPTEPRTWDAKAPVPSPCSPPPCSPLLESPPLPPLPRKCSSQSAFPTWEPEDPSDRRDRFDRAASDASDYTSHLSPVVSRKHEEHIQRKKSFTFYEGRDATLEGSDARLADIHYSVSPGLNGYLDFQQTYVVPDVDESIYENFSNMVRLDIDKDHDGLSKTIYFQNPPPRIPELLETLSDGGLEPAPKPCSQLPLGYLHPCVDDLEESSLATSESSSSAVDDLPLGATFSDFAQTSVATSDSGCPVDSLTDSGSCGPRARHSLSQLSVSGLSEALQGLGLRQQTLDRLQQEKVDGQLLMLLNETELREALPGLREIDMKKIRMFVSGWRPNMGMKESL